MGDSTVAARDDICRGLSIHHDGMKATLYFPRSQKKVVVMILAITAVLSLLVVTWAMSRVSAWVVYHDPVWMEMAREGAWLEHALVEIFLIAKDRVFIGLELVAGATFLGLLWHVLYRDEHTDGSAVIQPLDVPGSEC